MADPVSFRRRVYLTLERSDRSDRLGKAIDLALVTLIAINVVAVVLETVDWIHDKHVVLFTVIEAVSIAIFSVEYVLRVWASVENEKYHGETWPRLKYMRSPLAVIDLLAILPTFLSFLIPIDLRFLRVLRLLRVLKLTRYSLAMTMLLNVFHEERDAFWAALSIMAVMLVMAASGAYLVERNVQPEEFGSIPQALWWAVATLTTVGYGDVTPVTGLGKFLGGIVSVTGILMAALPAGILASGLADQLRRNREVVRSELRRILADGVIDAQEAARLEDLRKDLGLARRVVQEIIEEYQQEQADEPGQCPHCGKPLQSGMK